MKAECQDAMTLSHLDQWLKEEDIVCLHECARTWDVSVLPSGFALSQGYSGKRVWCFRFGVIHSVFTNLLLWANSVLNESKHQLNEHKERLITLGFGNITIGEEASPCWLQVPRGAT